MKIVHLNTHDSGGAAKACIRLHEGLLRIGIDSTLITIYKGNDIPNHESYFDFKKGISKYYRIALSKYFKLKEKLLEDKIVGRSFQKISLPRSAYQDIPYQEAMQNASIINLHWVAGMIDYSSFFSTVNKPIVWTLHDMNPFSGGYHYTYGMELQAKDEKRLHRIEKLKAKAIKRFKDSLHIVTPSSWLGSLSKESLVFGQLEHHLIHYGIPVENFKPGNQHFARAVFNINYDGPLIMFGANMLSNQIKGFDLFINLLRNNNYSNIGFLVVGGYLDNHDFGLNKVFYTGHISDEKLMGLAYSASDYYTILSYQDNFPNTIIESLCCGTPVLGFTSGGVPEPIEHLKNGIIMGEPNIDNLKHWLSKINNLSVLFDRKSIAGAANKKYSLDVQAKNYATLYCQLLKD